MKVNSLGAFFGEFSETQERKLQRTRQGNAGSEASLWTMLEGA